MRTLFLFLPFLFLISGCKTLESPTTVISESQTESAVFASGPMVGYSTMREVAVWVQTSQEVEVKMHYRGITENDEGTTPVEAGTGTFQTQALWQYRTNPPEFTFAAGSCVYVNQEQYDRPGTPYGGNYEIFTSIHEKSPDFMMWLGDNTYLREVDWNSMSGILNRYSHSRAVPEMQPLLANTHHYAIWDDHDFGPNDSDRSYHMKDSTLKAFNLFWANPTSGINGKPGITTKFQWNDCEFFLLDNRYYRTPNNRKTGDRFILGDEQIEWLIDNLAGSRASFKFVAVGGQVLNSAAKYENHATFPEERQKLIDLIHQEGIKNVIFLTGDRHHTELSKMAIEGKPTIYDLTASPLTSGTHNPRDEGNVYQVDGSFIHEKNFATVNVAGDFGERVVTITILDKNGKTIWDYDIQQE